MEGVESDVTIATSLDCTVKLSLYVIVLTTLTLTRAIADICEAVNLPLVSSKAKPLFWSFEDIKASICACVFVPILDNDAWSICSIFEDGALPLESRGHKTLGYPQLVRFECPFWLDGAYDYSQLVPFV